MAACFVPLWLYPNQSRKRQRPVHRTPHGSGGPSSPIRTPHAKWGAGAGDWPEGRHARRRRKFMATVALLLVPLMPIGPETILALSQEAMLYQAGFGAAVATGPTVTVIDYAYDDNGNLVEKAVQSGATTIYTYDAENRLVKVDPGEGPAGVITYAYDADALDTPATLCVAMRSIGPPKAVPASQGIAKTVGTAVTHYLVDKNRDYAQVLEERDGQGNLLVRYLYGHDLIAQQRGGQTRYYHYDGQMSTRLLTDPAGTVTDTYAYDAFGGLLTPMGPTTNNYLYTGEQYDANVGFYYLRARYYDASNGRFPAVDPLEGSAFAPISLHRYLYCGSDPVNHSDPSGMNYVSMLGTMSLQLMIRSMEAAPKIATYTWAATKIAGLVWLGSSVYRQLEREGWVAETGFTQHIVTASGAVFFAGFILTGMLESVPVPTGRVPYNSSYLSRQAISARQATGRTSGGNVAVFEYTENGRTKTIVRFAERFGGGHAERIAANELQGVGIAPSQVTRIYSELQPCSVPTNLSCQQMIQREFPQAKVCWSFDYGDDPESRRRGVAGLAAALSEMFGG